MTLTVGSLFSGIGGMDLGLERAGMKVRWQCEIEPYCRKVLAKHWPNVPCYEDVRDIDERVERTDVICGGFPCQPVSYAGRRKGADDDRWLWPEFARIIRLLRPRFVLLENVPGLLTSGFGTVIGDLAACGYDAEWDCIPAAAVGAPHLRYRVLVVAHANSHSQPSSAFHGDQRQGFMVPAYPHSDGVRPEQEPGRCSGSPTVTVAQSLANAQGRRLSVSPQPRFFQTRARPARRSGQSITDSEWSDHWAVEPNVGRVANGVPNRLDRLRALGNAVVPQVAEFVGRRIMEAA